MRIDYLNSVDTTIMGSRNGQAALFLWHSLRKKGMHGIKEEVLGCLQTAAYLRDQLTKHGVTCRLNDLSSTVVLERPVSQEFVTQWQLACENDIAHVVVMPNATTRLPWPPSASRSRGNQYIKILQITAMGVDG